jgi:hypothetical protein
MVALWHYLRRARGSKFGGYGLLHHHTIHHVALCYHINCLFPLENEQTSRTRDVCLIFRIRCHFADI